VLTANRCFPLKEKRSDEPAALSRERGIGTRFLAATGIRPPLATHPQRADRR
jgi:hypothetical protein